MRLKDLSVIILIVCAFFPMGLFAQEILSVELSTKRIDEASGLAISRVNDGILYCHNDSGGEASIFAIDTEGQLVAEIQIPGVTNRDWEDIATAIDPLDGKAYIYIGEIGDNQAAHSSIYIYRIPDLAITDSLMVAEAPTIFEVTYEDHPRDAEALFVDSVSGDVYIISKREERVGIYRLDHPLKSGEKNVAKRMGDMNLSWVTAADISPDGSKLLVKNYAEIRLYQKTEGVSITQALMGEGKKMPYQIEPQGEAICFDRAGKNYFTLSEAVGDAPQTLYYYR
nr:hypothetical protein [Candidatus Cloacimonadota bacterium]